MASALACGPELHDADVELEEVCGAQGPVRLLDVEVPTHATWGTAVIGEQRIAAWYDDATDASPAFEAYVLGACGTDATALGEREYPLLVDDAAFVCDPQTGEIRPLDVDTADVGEALGAGYDCNPSLRSKEQLFLRNWDSGTWGVLSSSGLVAIPVPLDPFFALMNTNPIAPYLSRWGHYGNSNEHIAQRVFAASVGGSLFLYDVETDVTQEIPGNFDALLVGDDPHGALLVESSEDGTTTWLLAEVGGDLMPGPAFDTLIGAVYGIGAKAGLLTANRLILGEDLSTLPRPDFVTDEAAVLRLADDRFVQATEARIVAWEGSTGRQLLDVPCPAATCSVPRYHAESDSLLSEAQLDPMTADAEVWRFPLDGTSPSKVLDLGLHQTWVILPEAPLRILRTSDGRAPHDLEVLDTASGAIDAVASRVDGLARQSHLPLPRPSPGTASSLEYFVRDGEDAGLWLVGVPR